MTFLSVPSVIKPTEIDRYSDHYFVNSRLALSALGQDPRVVYQVFQRTENALLCGMKYALQLLATLPGVEVMGLEDGTRISSLEPAMHIRGPVQALLAFETIYLGLLARMTRVATNVRSAVEAANGKPVLFFPARFDIPEAQEYDGYAAKVGGCSGASTPAEAAAFGEPAVGTLPHALIAAIKGDTVAATLALAQALPHESIWSLVDFENDSVKTSVAVFRAFHERGLRLSGVRLDTSQELVDESLQRLGKDERGVTENLVREVRRALDEAGGRDVKIAVSGGFSDEKIRRFEQANAPVDVYAVGERFLKGSTPFTSDIVGYYEG